MSINSAALSDLIDYDVSTLRVRSRESTHREFKQTYEPAKIARYLKALAAFSNHDGGALLFGVSDSPCVIVGVDDTAIPDTVDWQKRLRSYFEPAIIVQMQAFEAGGKTVIAVTVPLSSGRPVICCKDANETVVKGGKPREQPVLQQGMIYFRYAGGNETIRFAELSEMLRDREDKRLRAFLKNVELIHRLDPETVGIVDMRDGQGIKDGAQVYLSEEAARKLNVIDRGRFVESDQEGERAFVVAGTIQLNKAIREPPSEEDKNLPSEAAAAIEPELQKLYGPRFEFKSQHLAKAAAWLGIRTRAKCDPRYVIDEKKVKRVFYTRAGITLVTKQIQNRPLEAIRCFGSKAAVAAYEATRPGAPG